MNPPRFRRWKEKPDGPDGEEYTTCALFVGSKNTETELTWTEGAHDDACLTIGGLGCMDVNPSIMKTLHANLGSLIKHRRFDEWKKSTKQKRAKAVKK